MKEKKEPMLLSRSLVWSKSEKGARGRSRPSGVRLNTKKIPEEILTTGASKTPKRPNYYQSKGIYSIGLERDPRSYVVRTMW